MPLQPARTGEGPGTDQDSSRTAQLFVPPRKAFFEGGGPHYRFDHGAGPVGADGSVDRGSGLRTQYHDRPVLDVRASGTSSTCRWMAAARVRMRE